MRAGARLADRAAHDEQVAVAPLVGVTRTGRDVAPHVLRAEQERLDATLDLGRWNTDVDDDDATGQANAGTAHQSALEAGKRRREHRPYHGPLGRGAVGREPRGNVERDHRAAAGVHLLDGGGDRRCRLSAGPGAEQRVDDELGLAQRGGQRDAILDHVGSEPGGLHLAQLQRRIAAQIIGPREQEDLDLVAGPREPPPDDEPVAAVSPLAAHHRHAHAAVREPQITQGVLDASRRSPPGILHQRRARNPQLPDRPLIHPPHLVRREDRPHR